MQVSANQELIKPFQPVSVNLKFETETELNEFYSVFNHAAVLRGVSINGNEIRAAIRGAIGKYPNSHREFGILDMELRRIRCNYDTKNTNHPN